MDEAAADSFSFEFSDLIVIPKSIIQRSSGVPSNSGLVPQNREVLNANGIIVDGVNINAIAGDIPLRENLSAEDSPESMPKRDSPLPDLSSVFINYERKNIEAPGTMSLQNRTDKSNGLASATTLNIFPGSSVAVNPQQRQESAPYGFNVFSQTYQTNHPTCSVVSVVTLPQNGPPGMMVENPNYREQSGSGRSCLGHTRTGKQRVNKPPKSKQPQQVPYLEDKVTPTVEQPAEEKDNPRPRALPANNKAQKREGQQGDITSGSSSTTGKPKKLKMYEDPDAPGHKRALQAKLNREKGKEKRAHLESGSRMVEELKSQLSQARQNGEYLKKQLEYLQTDSNLSLRVGIYKRNVEETVQALNRIYGGPTRVELPQRLDQIMVRVTNDGGMKVIDNICAYPLDQLPSLSDAFNLERIEFDYNSREKKAIFK